MKHNKVRCCNLIKTIKMSNYIINERFTNFQMFFCVRRRVSHLFLPLYLRKILNYYHVEKLKQTIETGYDTLLCSIDIRSLTFFVILSRVKMSSEVQATLEGR